MRAAIKSLNAPRLTLPRELSTTLQNAVESLPLHPSTANLITTHIIRSKPFETHDTDPRHKHRNGSRYILPLTQLVHQYQTATSRQKQNRIVETLIRSLYFVWLNPTPLHLKPFLSDYQFLLRHWPVERDEDIKHLNDNVKRGEVLRDLWQKLDVDSVDITIDKMLARCASESPSELDRVEAVFRPIFEHYMFAIGGSGEEDVRNGKKGKRGVKSKSKGRKQQLSSSMVPVYGVPLNVHGQSIPECRVRNQLRKKIDEVGKFLLYEDPALSGVCETMLREVFDDPRLTRALRRRYKVACDGAYRIAVRDGKSIQFENVDFVE